MTNSKQNISRAVNNAAHTAFIAIGANLGDPKSQCINAVEKLNIHPNINVLKNSEWRWYKALTTNSLPQPDYCNGIVQIETKLPSPDLLAVCLKIEESMGRKRTPGERWLPRHIDLDLISYDQQIIETESLTLPHPELHRRIFVLEPLCDIAPEWKHPLLNKTALKLLEEIQICNSSSTPLISKKFAKPEKWDCSTV